MSIFSYKYSNISIQTEDVYNDIHVRLNVYPIDITYNIGNKHLEIRFDFELSVGQINILNNILMKHPKKIRRR